MRVQFFLAVLTICLFPVSLLANDGAPVKLRNKTITVAWTAQRTVMTPRGEKQSPRFSQQRTIYVSNAGNVFVKSAVEGSGGTKETEMAPGDKTPNGGGREIHFVRGKLLGMARTGPGAGRMIVSFDPSYSSCSVELTFGRPAGEKMASRNSKGELVELLGVTLSGQRCSIQDGNAFAN